MHACRCCPSALTTNEPIIQGQPSDNCDKTFGAGGNVAVVRTLARRAWKGGPACRAGPSADKGAGAPFGRVYSLIKRCPKSVLVGLHAHDAPLQHANQNARHFWNARQAKCQAFWKVTPNKTPSKWKKNRRQRSQTFPSRRRNFALRSKQALMVAAGGRKRCQDPLKKGFSSPRNDVFFAHT